MVALHHLFRHFRQRLAIDFHDDAVRLQIREHPIERETFFDVELVGRVFVKDNFCQQTVDGHDRHLALHGQASALFVQAHVFVRLELVQLHATLSVGHVFVEGLFVIARRRRENLRGRINAFGAAALLDPRAQVSKITIKGGDQPGEVIRGAPLEFDFGPEQILEPQKHPLKKRRVNLRAAVVVRPDVFQIGLIGERILSNDINVAAVEIRIARLAFRRDETFAEDHVRRTKPAGVRAAEEHRLAGHFRIHELCV